MVSSTDPAYVYVRETDNVLIRMPNQAFKLNRERLPDSALFDQGRPDRGCPEGRARQSANGEELFVFFSDFAAMLGGLCEHHRSRR
jgi:hypothetical protein